MPKPPAARPARATTAPSLEALLAKITEPKKLPSLVVPSALPPLVLRDGRPLDPEHVVAVLRASVGGHLDEGGLGARLREALAPESADAFALALLEQDA